MALFDFFTSKDDVEPKVIYVPADITDDSADDSGLLADALDLLGTVAKEGLAYNVEKRNAEFINDLEIRKLDAQARRDLLEKQALKKTNLNKDDTDTDNDMVKNIVIIAGSIIAISVVFLILKKV